MTLHTFWYILAGVSILLGIIQMVLEFIYRKHLGKELERLRNSPDNDK